MENHVQHTWISIALCMSVCLALLAIAAITPAAAATPAAAQTTVDDPSPASIETEIAQTSDQPTIEFPGGPVTEDAGDIAEVTVTVRNTQTAYLVIGGSDVGFLDVVALNDQNNDGQVTVGINTRYIGLNPASPGVPSVRSYRATSAGDSVYALEPTDELANPQGQTLAVLRSALEIDTTPPRTIRPGEYDLFVASTTDLQVIPDNRLNIADERDSNTLSLSRPTVGTAATFAAPRGPASTGSLSTLSNLSQRDEIAIGDRIAIRIDVSGVFGHLDAEHRSNIAAGIAENEAEGMSLTVEQTNPRVNQGTIRFDLSSEGVDVRVDPTNNRLYAVIDTRTVRQSRSLEAGQNYRAEFLLEGIDSDESGYDVRTTDDRAHDGYPYLQPGETLETSTTFQLRDRYVRVANLASDQLELQADDGVTIAGTTTIAPQSTLHIRTRGTSGTDIRDTTTATVRADGTWHTQQDFSELTTDDTVQIVVSDETGVLRTVDGVIVDDVATNGSDGADESNDSASLGILIPVVALLLVTLLVARRSQP